MMRFSLVLVMCASSLMSRPVFAQSQDLYDISTVREFNLSFSQPDWWQQLTNNYNRGGRLYIPADLEVDGVVYHDVGVRLRGKAAYVWANQFKKPFKIKMDAFVPGQELYGHDSLRLNNGSEDPTFCREAMMTNLMRDFMPSPKASFCVMTINGESWGVYINEQQKDKVFMREWFEADTGDRYKSVLGGNLSYLGPYRSSYEPLYENQAEDSPDSYEDLIEFCDILNNTPTGDALIDALWDVVNLDGALRMFAADCTFGNFDSYYFNRNNFYIMKDDHHDTLEIINHDLNLTFGTWLNYPPTLSPEYRIQSNLIPFVKRPMESLWLRRQYIAHIRTLIDTVFRWDVVSQLLEEYQNLIRPHVYADPKKMFSNEDFERNVTEPVQGIANEIPGISPYVNARHDFLAQSARVDVPIVTLENLRNLPACPNHSEPVVIQATVSGSVSARSLELRWRVRGAFVRAPMFDDGAHGDGLFADGIFGAVIPPQPSGAKVEYYVLAIAREANEGASFFPHTASHAPLSYRIEGQAGPMTIINEFMASNDSTIADEFGDYDDWFELINSEASVLDLSGSFLTDDLNVPTKFALPQGTFLSPGASLLIWADGEPNQGPFHAPFKLAAGGEEVALFDIDGMTLLDSFVFGPQLEDQSTGRLFDGGSPWMRFPAPTPARDNQPDCGVRPFAPLRSDVNFPVLRFEGRPELGQPVALIIEGGPPNELVALILGTAPAQLPLGGNDVLLIDPTTISFSVGLRLDALGRGACPFTLPTQSGITDPVYFQGIALCIPPSLTNAIELAICR